MSPTPLSSLPTTPVTLPGSTISSRRWSGWSGRSRKSTARNISGTAPSMPIENASTRDDGTEDAGEHQVDVGVDAHRLERGDFTHDPVGRHLGGDGGARAADDDERRQQRPQLADHRDHHDGADAGQRAYPAQLGDGLRD